MSDMYNYAHAIMLPIIMWLMCQWVWGLMVLQMERHLTRAPVRPDREGLHAFEMKRRTA